MTTGQPAKAGTKTQPARQPNDHEDHRNHPGRTPQDDADLMTHNNDYMIIGITLSLALKAIVRAQPAHPEETTTGSVQTTVEILACGIAEPAACGLK
jgi:hypothetical protein